MSMTKCKSKVSPFCTGDATVLYSAIDVFWHKWSLPSLPTLIITSPYVKPPVLGGLLLWRPETDTGTNWPNSTDTRLGVD